MKPRIIVFFFSTYYFILHFLLFYCYDKADLLIGGKSAILIKLK